MRTPLGDRILAQLKLHRGLESAITAPQLSVEIGLHERDVRKVIARESRHWTDEGLILARPGHGFFFATEAEEVAHRQAMLLSLKYEAAVKVADFQQLMRACGFGGLVHEGPKTFAHESHPEKRGTLSDGGGSGAQGDPATAPIVAHASVAPSAFPNPQPATAP